MASILRRVKYWAELETQHSFKTEKPTTTFKSLRNQKIFKQKSCRQNFSELLKWQQLKIQFVMKSKKNSLDLYDRIEWRHSYSKRLSFKKTEWEKICTAKHNNEATVWRTKEYDTTFVYKQSKQNRLAVELLRNMSCTHIEIPIMSHRSHLQKKKRFRLLLCHNKSKRISFS